MSAVPRSREQQRIDAIMERQRNLRDERQSMFPGGGVYSEPTITVGMSPPPRRGMAPPPPEAPLKPAGEYAREVSGMNEAIRQRKLKEKMEQEKLQLEIDREKRLGQPPKEPGLTPEQKLQEERRGEESDIEALDTPGLQAALADPATSNRKKAHIRKVIAQREQEEQLGTERKGRIREDQIKEAMEKIDSIIGNDPALIDKYTPSNDAERAALARLRKQYAEQKAKGETAEDVARGREDIHSERERKARVAAAKTWARTTLKPDELKDYAYGPKAAGLTDEQHEAVLDLLDKLTKTRESEDKYRTSIGLRIASHAEALARVQLQNNIQYQQMLMAGDKGKAQADRILKDTIEKMRPQAVDDVKKGADLFFGSKGGAGGAGGVGVEGGAGGPGGPGVAAAGGGQIAGRQVPAPEPAFAESEGRRVTLADLKAKQKGEMGRVGPVRQDVPAFGSEEERLSFEVEGGGRAKLRGVEPGLAKKLIGESAPYAESEGRTVYQPQQRASETDKAITLLNQKDDNALASALLEMRRDPGAFRRRGVDVAEVFRSFPQAGLS